MARNPDEILADVVQLVVGVQVPVSIVGAKAALGTGHEAWSRLREDMTGGHSFGWLGTDTSAYIETLREALCVRGVRDAGLVDHLIRDHEVEGEVAALNEAELVVVHRRVHGEKT